MMADVKAPWGKIDTSDPLSMLTLGLFGGGKSETDKAIEKAEQAAAAGRAEQADIFGTAFRGIPGAGYEADYSGLSGDELRAAQILDQAIAGDPVARRFIQNADMWGIPEVTRAWEAVQQAGGFEGMTAPPYGAPGYGFPDPTYTPEPMPYRMPEFQYDYESPEFRYEGKYREYGMPEEVRPTTQFESDMFLGAAGMPTREGRLVERLGPSEAAAAGPDALSVLAQYGTLQELNELYRAGGLGAEDRARLAEIQQRNAQIERSQREAIAQQMETRGLGGGGQELLGALAAQQQGATARSMESLGVEALAEQRKMDLLREIGGLATDVRGQSFEEKYKTGTAADLVNEFNTRSANEALQRDIAYNQGLTSDMAQRLSEANRLNVGARNVASALNTDLYNTALMGDVDFARRAAMGNVDYWRQGAGGNIDLRNQARILEYEEPWRAAAMQQGYYVPYAGNVAGLSGTMIPSYMSAGMTADQIAAQQQGNVWGAGGQVLGAFLSNPAAL